MLGAGRVSSRTSGRVEPDRNDPFECEDPIEELDGFVSSCDIKGTTIGYTLRSTKGGFKAEVDTKWSVRPYDNAVDVRRSHISPSALGTIV